MINIEMFKQYILYIVIPGSNWYKIILTHQKSHRNIEFDTITRKSVGKHYGHANVVEKSDWPIRGMHDSNSVGLDINIHAKNSTTFCVYKHVLYHEIALLPQISLVRGNKNSLV